MRNNNDVPITPRPSRETVSLISLEDLDHTLANHEIGCKKQRQNKLLQKIST